MSSETKSCKRCGESKPLDQFEYNRQTQKHYLSCKACRMATESERMQDLHIKRVNRQVPLTLPLIHKLRASAYYANAGNDGLAIRDIVKDVLDRQAIAS